MAVPKTKNAASSKAKAAKKERVSPLQSSGQYLKEVRSEFRKVMWPSRQEVISAAIVVFVTLIFFVAFTALVDFIFSGLINRLLPLIGG